MLCLYLLDAMNEAVKADSELLLNTCDEFVSKCRHMSKIHIEVLKEIINILY